MKRVRGRRAEYIFSLFISSIADLLLSQSGLPSSLKDTANIFLYSRDFLSTSFISAISSSEKAIIGDSITPASGISLIGLTVTVKRFSIRDISREPRYPDRPLESILSPSAENA